MNSDLDEVFDRLARSAFRGRFRLRAAEKDYLERRGLDTVMEHGGKFIEERLAPADPANNGKQTPMRNHPIFIASMRPQPAAGAAWRNGMGYPRGTP